MPDSNIALSLNLPKPPHEKQIIIAARRARLETCSPQTRKIHDPIVDLYDVRGYLNPAGLGKAKEFSLTGNLGQSSVGFLTLTELHEADEIGEAIYYGGAEYGVVRTPEADAVCRKMAALHNAIGAVICSSGLSAIATVMETFKPRVVLIPDNVYYPTFRYLVEENIKFVRYSPRDDMTRIRALMNRAVSRYGADQVMMYLEAPGSGTFEIANIAGIVELSNKKRVRTVMDNTWASHARCKPIDLGVDIVIQATTKYEGGYADTKSGVILAANHEDLGLLKRRLRVSGHGSIDGTICARLFHRLNSTEERMDEQFNSAMELVKWFSKQPFVGEIFCPALPSSPDHARFQEYFGKGNGLFSVAFQRNLPPEAVQAFADSLYLFRAAESWGGHVSLVNSVGDSHRKLSKLPPGETLRFHAGLEHIDDLLHDLELTAGQIFGSNPALSGIMAGLSPPAARHGL